MRHGVERGTLRTEAIQTMVEAAAERARALEIQVHIAVMDSAADLVGWLSFDGTPRIAATTARHTLSGGCCDEFLGASAGRGETDGGSLEICAVSIAAAHSGALFAGGAGKEKSSDGARCVDFGWAVARRALAARAGTNTSVIFGGLPRKCKS